MPTPTLRIISAPRRDALSTHPLFDSAAGNAGPISSSVGLGVRIVFAVLVPPGAVCFGELPQSRREPPLRSRIEKIGRVCAIEQMVWPDAWRVVAMVEDVHPVWDRADMHFVAIPVGTHHAAVFPATANNPIPVVGACRPQPTPRPEDWVDGAVFVHLCPESVDHRTTCINTSSHSALLPKGAWGGQGQRGRHKRPTGPLQFTPNRRAA